MRVLLLLIMSSLLFAAGSTSKVASLLVEKNVFSGPNCSNAALRALGLMEGRRYVHNPELQDFLGYNCKEEKEGRLGVIFVVQNKAPIHVFVKQSASVVFTKNGASKRSKNILQKYDLMYAEHKKASHGYCVTNKIKDCQLVVKYFNCIKPSEVTLENIEKHLDFMGRHKDNFFSVHYQEKLMDMALKIDWSSKCEYKKSKLLSFILTVSLAAAGNRSIKEREYSKDLEKKLRAIHGPIKCS